MKELLETYVGRVSVSAGEHYLMFHGIKEAITYEAYGDCCSETWFADITGLDNLRGQVVIGVRVLDVTLPEGDLRTRQEHDQVYGYRLSTQKGDCDIIFRNSSNGYYGGKLVLVRSADSLSRGPFPETFTEITTDEWSA